MLSSSFFVFHCWRHHGNLLNDKNGSTYPCFKEIETIISNCPLGDEDKIRSSHFIEALTTAYDLNEELKIKLINKLDPDKNDLLYSKQELFFIFQEWISSGAASNRELCIPAASTPRHGQIVSLRHPRIKLFFDEESFRSDQGNVETKSNSSGSVKKRLSFRQSILESKLETFEKSAYSLEKQFENAKNLCTQQKFENERLKQEIKVLNERDQWKDEMYEELRKIQIETERRHCKAQADLSAVRLEIKDLKDENIILKQELAETNERLQNCQDGLERERESSSHLVVSLTERQDADEMLRQRVSDQEAIIKLMGDEILILKDENNYLRNQIANIPYSGQGIPLCEELPSEMFQGPLESSDLVSPEAVQSDLLEEREVQQFSDSFSCPQVNVKEVKSQTEDSCNYPHMKLRMAESQTEDASYYPCMELMVAETQTEVTSNYPGMELKVAESQTEDTSYYPCMELMVAETQTEDISYYPCMELTVAETQTEDTSSYPYKKLNEAETQTEDSSKHSQIIMQVAETQSEVGSNYSEINVNSVETQTRLTTRSFSSQTEVLISSSVCQTEPHKMFPALKQPLPLVNSSHSQTETLIKVSITSQTNEMYDTSTQTHKSSVTCKGAQTDSRLSNSAQCQTEKKSGIYSFSTSNNEPISSWAQTEVLRESCAISQQDRIKKSVSACTCKTDRWSLSSIAYNSLVMLCSIFFGILAVAVVYGLICRNNRCYLELRYPRGRPT